MTKRYKIVIGYNPETKNHTIELFKHVTWLWWSWWWPSLFWCGSQNDVFHYSAACQAEFKVAPEDINDTRE